MLTNETRCSASNFLTLIFFKDSFLSIIQHFRAPSSILLRAIVDWHCVLYSAGYDDEVGDITERLCVVALDRKFVNRQSREIYDV